MAVPVGSRLWFLFWQTWDQISHRLQKLVWQLGLLKSTCEQFQFQKIATHLLDLFSSIETPGHLPLCVKYTLAS